MTITERIFYLIKARGMSQNSFGKAAGIAPSTISDWKTKGHTPSADNKPAVSFLCEELGTGTFTIQYASLASSHDACSAGRCL